MNNQRMKWDAEAAFKRIEHDSKIYAQEPGQGERASRFLHGKQPHRFGWTPAPTKPAYSQTNVNAHLEHKGRDYEALTKAALRKPVGYWEDAPRGMKFGGQPLPSAVTKPHGKDVDTADGPWPKCVNWFGIAVYVFAGPAKNQGLYHRDDGTTDRAAGDYADRLRNGGVSMPNPEASQWLEQNGHADVAAQLRGKTTTPPADDEFEPVGTMPAVGDTYVFTDGRGDNPVTFVDVSATHYADRVWARQCQDNGELWTSDSTHAEREWYARNGRILKRPTKPRDDVATGARVWRDDDGFAWVQLAGVMYGHMRGMRFIQSWCRADDLNPKWELRGTERDAIVAECRKAMGI